MPLISAIFLQIIGILDGSFTVPLKGSGERYGESVSVSILSNGILLTISSFFAFLKVKTLDEITELKKLADINKIPNYLVVDAGRTQIPSSSVTVLALGPDEDEKIDKITGDLKLL